MELPDSRRDPLHLDTLVRLEVGRPCNAWMIVTIVDAPAVPKPPPRPSAELDRDPDDTVIY